MFTGIIEEVGTVKSIGGGVLAINAQKVLEDVQLGDSIAVNGVCLTVTSFTSKGFTADVMPETLRRSSLGELKHGSPVNLERALTLSSRLGGHIVSGHIDGVGKIISLKEEANAILMKIGADADILRYIVEKGSVSLDGISLTVAGVDSDSFVVSLIPHTRQVTNLHSKGIGSAINIENDVVGKYVEKLLQPRENAQAKSPQAGSITMAFLQENGF
ncbi:MAG: riboflavin synthase [Anaerovibrio sp.]|nr:riboflavin synthase [Selenomonadaceae bacterium]MDD6397838.1 riboflavin synthase [Selenomonadaceae bacterium]MDY6052708.1 riboflavin synthase [Anaerovibrio sp.]